MVFSAPVLAQVEEAPQVTDSSLVADSLAVDSLALMGPFPPAEDAAWARFVPPSRWRSIDRRHVDDLLAGPSWPMPPPEVIAGGDLADWLSYHPGYDVDDAPGVGQTRFFTRWGLVNRTGDWQVDGRSVSWQRLTFPMTPQFDPAILPSFNFKQPHVGDEVILERDTAWGDRPVFDYTFRQGDFSDSYSEGLFRAHTKKGFGLDLSGVFFSSDGRYASDNRDKRILSLETFGPVKKNLYWRTRYEQFRDKTLILTPEPFDAIHPKRDDLLWSLEGALAGIADSGSHGEIGVRVQRGKQRLLHTETVLDSSNQLVKDTVYSTNARDFRVEIQATRNLAGWDFDASVGREGLDIDSIDAARWFVRISGSHLWQLNHGWTAALAATASDYGSATPGFEGTVALSPGPSASLSPRIRASRARAVPTLFDLDRPEVEYTYISPAQEGFLYSEAGDPSLEDQWENSVSVQWGAETLSDSAKFDWSIGGYATYVQNHTLWDGRAMTDSLVGLPVVHYSYRPRQSDVRSLGAAVGIHGRAIWKIHYLANYAIKYVTDLDNVKLSGYYPHKASAMVSLIAPKWKYGVDVRLNAAGLWWYADSRIDPTGYETSHVFRLDLSGSARIVGDLTIYALVQNVANFPYRTGAGYPFTGRTVRFGLHVILFD